jgi:hypothetical protein
MTSKDDIKGLVYLSSFVHDPDHPERQCMEHRQLFIFIILLGKQIKGQPCLDDDTEWSSNDVDTQLKSWFRSMVRVRKVWIVEGLYC